MIVRRERQHEKRHRDVSRSDRLLFPRQARVLGGVSSTFSEKKGVGGGGGGVLGGGGGGAE